METTASETLVTPEEASFLRWRALEGLTANGHTKAHVHAYLTKQCVGDPEFTHLCGQVEISLVQAQRRLIALQRALDIRSGGGL